MKNRTIHEWSNWLLEKADDDTYELSNKGSLSVHTIVTKNTMDAENQCQQIIKKVKEAGAR